MTTGKKHKRRKRRLLRPIPLLLLLLFFLCMAAAAWWFLAHPNGTEDRSDAAQSGQSADGEEPGQNPDNAGETSAGTDGTEENEEQPEEPSEEEILEEQALQILSTMTLEEKAGQMFIARCPEEDAAEKAEEYHLGGYILFARDFEGKTLEQAAADIQSYQDAAEIPMLIGVDEEGGTVNRISRYAAFRQEPFPSSQELYQEGGFEAVREDTLEKCRLLKSLGVNVNFAPVCDVSQDPADFIYERSFGQDAGLTSEYVKTVVEAMKGQGVACVLKHFPGYGNNTDTHTGIAYDNRPYETFETSDFLPFEAGMESGAEMVLVSHNIVSCMDEQYPAWLFRCNCDRGSGHGWGTGLYG